MKPGRLTLNLNQKLVVFMTGIFFFFISRQVPFNNLSVIMNVSLLAVYFFSFKIICQNIARSSETQQFAIALLTGLLILSIFYSFFLENNIGLVFRFFLISIFLIYSFYISLPQKAIDVFIAIILLQAIGIILFSVYLTFFFTQETYFPIRMFFQEREWGDVYTYNGWLYIVQVKGNALLPFALFITYFHPRLKRKAFIRAILIVACVIAGNFAYLISIAVFHIIYFLRSNNTKIVLMKIMAITLFLASISIPVYNSYIKEILNRKQEISFGTRIDQTNVLVDDLTSTLSSSLLGQGLGNTIDKTTPFRDYTGYIYYELQALYMLNQMGIILYCLFSLFIFLVPFIRWKNKWLFVTYICYIIYAVTNPYIFDSNHIAVIIILNTIDLNKHKLFNQKEWLKLKTPISKNSIN